jgi:tRNA(fMet)-specific endonuclease VapC
MICLLDTDLMSMLQRDSPQARRLETRLLEVEHETTIITFEEQMRGWLAWLARAKNLAEQVDRYAKLKNTLEQYTQFTVIDFDDAAARVFYQLQQQRLRIGTMDLKIAAIAIANNATLLSRNLKDFGKIPTLQVEDWAA